MKGSSYHHHHLIHYEEPYKETRMLVDLICYSSAGFDPQHKDGIMCRMNLKPGQKALVLRLSLVHTHSDCKEEIRVQVLPMFEALKPASNTAVHPDYTGGACTITIPG